MSAHLSPRFPCEAANNLLCSPQYLWDCKNIWVGRSKREKDSIDQMSIFICLKVYKQVLKLSRVPVMETTNKGLVSVTSKQGKHPHR